MNQSILEVRHLRTLVARQPLPGYLLKIERIPPSTELLAFRPVP